MNGYNAANHDFTLRHALQNMKTAPTINQQTKNPNPKLQHLWNTATSNTQQQSKNELFNKSRSEPNIQPQEDDVLQATQSFAKIKGINNCMNNKQDEVNDEYNEDSARQIVNEFAARFPIFKSKLAQQFPKEWLNVSEIEEIEKHNPYQLFQFSQLERTERERIIQELYEYGPTQKYHSKTE